MDPRFSPFLGTKELLPGISENNVYYTADNVLKQMVPVVYDNKTILSAPSIASGGQITVNIPNADIASSTMLYMRLGQVGAADNIKIPQGWGFAIIDRVRIRIAGASEISMSGVQHYSEVMLQCENQSKRNDVLELAGDRIDVPAAAVFPEAVIPLALPWSKIDSLCRKKGVDTNLISQPINLVIELKSFSTLVGGSDRAAYLAANNQFQEAYVAVRQGRLMNADDSLRMTMLAQPDFIYSYPFVYQQDGDIKGFTTTVANQRVSTTLTGFKDGDLLALGFALTKDSDGVAVDNGVNPLRLYGDKLSDVELVFNGNIIWRADDSSRVARLWDLFGNPSASRWLLEGFDLGTGAATDFADQFIHEMVVAQFPPDCPVNAKEMQQVGMRVGTNTMQLSFTVADAGTYTLHTMYKFNGIIKFQAGRAEVVV